MAPDQTITSNEINIRNLDWFENSTVGGARNLGRFLPAFFIGGLYPITIEKIASPLFFQSPGYRTPNRALAG